MDKKPATNRKGGSPPDPVQAALRRLLSATDKTIHVSSELRKARVELAKVVEGRRDE